MSDTALARDMQWLLQEKYRGEKSEAFFTDCKRLVAGEPLGYVIGHVPFLDCTIWLDSKPLIPRPETEYWVEKFIQYQNSTDVPASQSIMEWPQRLQTEQGQAEIMTGAQAHIHILDLCAGSGAIGVAVAKQLPHTTVDFGEIDGRHLPTIEKNLQKNHITTKRCRLITSDLFEHISDRYDFILSNPPYIDPTLNRTEASVTNFEPHQALYGGRDGLALMERIIATAPVHLTPNGQLWIEHEPEQTIAIQHLAHQYGFISNAHTDQYHIERYSVLVLQ